MKNVSNPPNELFLRLVHAHKMDVSNNLTLMFICIGQHHRFSSMLLLSFVVGSLSGSGPILAPTRSFQSRAFKGVKSASLILAPITYNFDVLL